MKFKIRNVLGLLSVSQWVAILVTALMMVIIVAATKSSIQENRKARVKASTPTHVHDTCPYCHPERSK